jgi:hypothetical protein
VTGREGKFKPDLGLSCFGFGIAQPAHKNRSVILKRLWPQRIGGWKIGRMEGWSWMAEDDELKERARAHERWEEGCLTRLQQLSP